MLLIHPVKEKFGGFLSRYVPVGIPVALGCLSAYLTKNGIKTKVIDEELTEVTPSTLRELTEGLEKPYIFGLSLLTAHAVRGYELAEMIKTEFPDSVVIAGGVHVSILPDAPLNCRYIDYLVRGEGEETLLRLYNALRGAEDPTELLGVSFRRDGQIIHNPDAPLIPDLDDIPLFPYELFENPKYDMGFITTSRGCPYKCTYCSQRVLTGSTYRFRSPEKVLEELDILVNHYKQKQIVFYDDNFCIKKKRVTQLCELIIEHGFHNKCKYSVQTRADNFHEDIVPIMLEAGFAHVGFGMETGVDRIAELVGKEETTAEHFTAIDLAKKYGMDISIFMIFGFPTETAEDRKASFDVVQSTGIEATKYNNLIPYPGTPLYKDLKDGDRIHIEPGFSNFNSTLSVTRSIFNKTPLPYVPETASEFELKRDIIRYNFKSYLTWRAVMAILTGKKGPGWYSLPNHWYFKPKELFEMFKIGITLISNVIVAGLPLVITEPVMNLLNPAMKRRPRITDYKAEDYEPSGWSKAITREKSLLLKAARQEKVKASPITLVNTERTETEDN
jgi:anaerobic magnesium-protoporphyrin IX monomethyl ester cyclase